MKRILFTIFSGTLLILIASCASSRIIPADLSYTQLIQMGQDEYEIGNYKAAEEYYSAVIQRFGMNTNVYIEATYELGHLYLNRKDYERAFAKFNEIIELYETAEFGVLPASFKKLSQLGIDRIPEKFKPGYN